MSLERTKATVRTGKPDLKVPTYVKEKIAKQQVLAYMPPPTTNLSKQFNPHSPRDKKRAEEQPQPTSLKPSRTHAFRHADMPKNVQPRGSAAMHVQSRLATNPHHPRGLNSSSPDSGYQQDSFQITESPRERIPSKTRHDGHL